MFGCMGIKDRGWLVDCFEDVDAVFWGLGFGVVSFSMGG